MTGPDPHHAAALLRALDDPVHLERPAGFEYEHEQARFRHLVATLDREFDCSCWSEAGSRIQDASLLGWLVVPAGATRHGIPVHVEISNFGLAVVCAERPGAWDDEESAILVDEADRRRVHRALDGLGYEQVPEDLLRTEYDGASDVLRRYYEGKGVPGRTAASWYLRYFDYL